MFEGETWRTVPSYSNTTEASSLGRVRRKVFVFRMHHGGTCIRGGVPTFGSPGYPHDRLVYSIGKKLVLVHTLICEAFHGPRPSDDHVCMHLDENCRNNRSNNLAWGTRKENMNAPGFMTALAKRGGVGRPKLTQDALSDLARQGGDSRSLRRWAERYGVTLNHVHNLYRNNPIVDALTTVS